MNVWNAPRLALALAVTLCGACGSTSKASFYLLDGVPPTESIAEAAGVSIGVGPIKIPDYLDRPQLVRRGAGQAVELDEFERWAEPLGASIQRVLITDLSTLLGTGRVIGHNDRGLGPVAYRVALDIDRFEGIGDGSVVLDARWAIFDELQELALQVRRTRVSIPGVGPAAGARVTAMNDAFADLSREIAAALAGMVQAP